MIIIISGLKSAVSQIRLEIRGALRQTTTNDALLVFPLSRTNMEKLEAAADDPNSKLRLAFVSVFIVFNCQYINLCEILAWLDNNKANKPMASLLSSEVMNRYNWTGTKEKMASAPAGCFY